jgi:hypothetical protein
MNLKKLRLVLIVALPLIFFSCSAQEKKIVIGILPTYDTSGQSYGVTVSQFMTGLLYQQFAQNPRFQPVFLNPGGLYDPSTTSWVSEYVQTLGMPMDVVLATTFIEPETPKHGDLILHLRSVQLDSKTGEALQTTVASASLKDRSAYIDFGMTYIPTGYFSAGSIYQPSRNFQKQAIGKTTFELAKQSADTIAQGASKLTASGETAGNFKAVSCKMTLKINYVEKHAISKSYGCIINEKEEALGIKEGVLEVEEPASPVLIQIKLNDAPYKLPKQELYLFDPTLDCSRGSNFLDINIGAAGEARYKWR